MQPPPRTANPPTQGNPYGPLAPPSALPKQGKKSKRKLYFEFKSEPPLKPLPVPKLEFDDCCVPKLASVCTSKLDETRYSKNRVQYLLKLQPHYEHKIRVVTWNLLMKGWEKRLNPTHPAYDPSQLWINRVQLIAAAIDRVKPAIIGCQELYENEAEKYNQEDDLYNYIGIAYERYSVKSPDGEHNTIFLKRDVFKVIHAHTYQCVDKAIGEVIAVFREQKLVIINTHFSIDPNARETQARFVASKIREHHKDKDLVIFLVDGNLLPNNPFNVISKAGWDGPYIESILKEDNLIEDAFNKSLFGNVGSSGTYTNDQYNVEPFKGRGTAGARLDRIFVSRKIEVFSHAIDPFISGGKPSSDHQAVIADLHIPEKSK